MREKDRSILRLLADRVWAKYPDAEVCAFGSRVRDEATATSDLDVCVVLGSLTEAVDQEIMDIAWEVGFSQEVVISTLTFSRAEFTSGPLTASPIVQTIRREGVAA